MLEADNVSSLEKGMAGKQSPRKHFSTMSSLGSGDWTDPSQICQQCLIFGLIHFWLWSFIFYVEGRQVRYLFLVSVKQLHLKYHIML